MHSPGETTLDDDEDQQTAVNDFLAILEEHKKNCEQAGKYIEADIAKKRLEELRQHEVRVHRIEHACKAICHC